MIDWKQKLSSRKFWLALVGFITPVLFLLNFAESDIESIVSIIMAGASLIAYILAEGFVDGKRQDGTSGDTFITNYPANFLDSTEDEIKVGGTE